MKQYIKTLAAVLLLGLTFVSCNDNFDEDDNKVDYPAELPLGTWAKEYTPAGGVSYTVNITLNEVGDTICDVTLYNETTGDANVFGAGEVSYDPATGVATVNYAESLYDMPAMITLAYQQDLQKMTVNIYTVSGNKLTSKDLFKVVKAAAISPFGDWTAANGLAFTLNADGTATVTDGGATEEGTFTFDGTSGKITTKSGKEITLSFNAQGQMMASNGGEPFYVQHIMTQPKNDWYVYANGIYHSGGCGKLFGNEEEWPASMEYSPSRKMLRINEFLNPGSVLTAYWSIGEMSVDPAEKNFYSGLDHPQYGSIYAVPATITSDGRKAIYEDGVFYFGFDWQVPGVGSFGAAIDTFTITEEL